MKNNGELENRQQGKAYLFGILPEQPHSYDTKSTRKISRNKRTFKNLQPQKQDWYHAE